MQKILSLVWFKIYPPHFGGQKGIALFNKAITPHFSVDCLCSRDNSVEADAGCRILPLLPAQKKQFFLPISWKIIRKQLASATYRYVILEQPYYGWLAPWLKQKKRILIIHTHNIESQRFKSLGKRFWRFLALYEKWCLKRADLVLFKTEKEKKFALTSFGLKSKNCYVLPYGIEAVKDLNKVAARAFLSKKYGIKEDEKIILFAGTLDYAPNAEAVEKIYRVIAPLLEQKRVACKILVCGRNRFPAFGYLKKLKSAHVIQTGFVPDIAPYFSGSDIFIAPVGNIHGVQTKIFDALNYRLNVVCFASAAEDLPHYLDHKLFVAKDRDYEDFTDNLIKGLNDTFATPEVFYQEYSWNHIINKFVNYLDQHFPVNQ
ncbi:MAG: glycosyltransferase family 4 protein [Flavisolibacter sp.]